MCVVEGGCGLGHVLADRPSVVEGFVFLGVVAEFEAVSGHDAPRVGFLDAGQEAQQRRLTGTVQAKHDDLGAAVDGQVHAGEDFEGAVGLGEAFGGERDAPGGGGVGEAQARNLFLDDLPSRLGEEFFGAAQHLLGGDGFGGLGTHLFALGLEVFGFLQGVGAFLAAAALVFLALLEVGVPPQVIDVDVSAVGIQVKDLVDGVAQELNVVGDDHDAAGEGLDPVAQPHDRVVVEVVGRLVEEEHIRVGEEHAGEFDAAALTARERVEPLVEDAVFKAEGVRDLRSLGVGGPSTGVGELLVELDVAFHGPLLASALGRGHLVLGLANARDDRVDAAHGDDAVASLHLRVTNVGVLREVADGAVGADGAGVLGRSPTVGFSGEETHRRGLAGTVASDEADAHAFIDPEGYVVDEFAGTDSQREVLDVNHAPRVEGGAVVGESTRPMTRPVGPPCSNCGHNGWCI